MRGTTSDATGGSVGKAATNVATATTAKSKHRRVARPPQSQKDLAAAAARREELAKILRLRGRPLDRDKLTAAEKDKLKPYFRAVDAYLRTHDDFAVGCARKLDARHVPLEDAAQACRLGLMKAVDKFDEKLLASGSVGSLLTYARWWVRNEVGKLLDAEMLVAVPSAHRKLAGELKAMAAMLGEALGIPAEDVPDAQLAQVVTAEQARVAAAAGRRRPPGVSAEAAGALRGVHLGHEHAAAEGCDVDGEEAGRPAHEVEAAIQRCVADDAADLADKGLLHLTEEAVASLPLRQRAAVKRWVGMHATAEEALVPPRDRATEAALVRAGLGRLRAAVGVGA